MEQFLAYYENPSYEELMNLDGIGDVKVQIRQYGEGHARGLVVTPKALEIRKDYYETL